MGYFQKVSLSEFFHEVYSVSQQYLGSVYMNMSARRWAIKGYPGQWFDSEKTALGWLIDRNEPRVKDDRTGVMPVEHSSAGNVNQHSSCQSFGSFTLLPTFVKLFFTFTSNNQSGKFIDWQIRFTRP